MLIAWILFGLLALVVAVRLFARWRLRSAEKGSRPVEDGRMPPCKETCDIHGKVGDPVRHGCGHDDAPEFKIDLWGEPLLHVRPDKGDHPCSDCMLKKILAVSIRCGCCGYGIMPGDPISLCVDDGSGKKAWRTVFDGNLALCLRSDCDAAPGFCGHWTGKGIKPAFPDGRGMIAHAFSSGEPVSVRIEPLEGEKEDA